MVGPYSLAAINDQTKAVQPSDGLVGSIGFQVYGTFTGLTLNFEASINQSDWVAAMARSVTAGTSATTATAVGIYIVDSVPAGMYVRARASAISTGAALVGVTPSIG